MKELAYKANYLLHELKKHITLTIEERNKVDIRFKEEAVKWLEAHLNDVYTDGLNEAVTTNVVNRE